jgi:hypothetical protein
MSLDLNKLEKKLNEALSNETTETLTKFLNNKRMKNETNKITLTSMTNTTATTASTTSTTFLCTKFMLPAISGATEPHCTKCGKFSYQHPIITNTL